MGSFDDKILNDYGELSHYPEIILSENHATVKMIPDFYDDRTARIHVHRIREILSNPPCYMTHSCSPYLQSAMDGINPAAFKKGKKFYDKNRITKEIKEKNPNDMP